MIKQFLLIGLMFYASTFYSCESFLSEKPSSSLAIPNSVGDLQAIMDYQERMNAYYPPSGDIASDYFYLLDPDWQSRPEYARDTYTWQSGVDIEQDWGTSYQRIFYANVVLGAIDEASLGGLTEADRQHVKGSALFFRGWTFLQLAQLFVPPYEASNEDSPYGLPLKLTADINDKTQRATVGNTYRQIEADLRNAVQLLPERTRVATRPSKAAAYAALARMYLAMQDYSNALQNADSSLFLQSELLDFNALNEQASNPFGELNKEVIFHALLLGNSGMHLSTVARVDTTLYRQYTGDDLRKHLFFALRPDGSLQFKGTYLNTTSGVFSGLAVDELYITKAECLIRAGKIEEGMEVLDDLLRTRWKLGKYSPMQWSNADEALAIVLEERRKELVFRGGIRWMDLRRLNQDSRFETTLTRIVNGETYHLEPNDPRYTYLIPSIVIAQSGMIQNPN